MSKKHISRLSMKKAGRVSSKITRLGDFKRSIGDVEVKRKAKTHKGRNILAARESEEYPKPKGLLLMKGHKCSPAVQSVLCSLRDMKKPSCIFLSGRKQKNMNPFEDPSDVEYLTYKNQCGVFCMGLTNKKKPARLFMGRLYNKQILDLYDFMITHHIPSSEFKNVVPPLTNAPPIVLLQGGLWESNDTMKSLGNFFADLFRGIEVGAVKPKVYPSGIDRVISISTVEPPQPSAESDASKVNVFIRHYKLSMKRDEKDGNDSDNSNKRSYAHLDEVGPQINLRLENNRPASTERWKSATKLPSKAKIEARKKRAQESGEPVAAKKSKNITTTPMGDVVGRVYVGNADFGRINQTLNPMIYNLQRREKKNAENDAASDDGADNDE